MVPKLNYVLMVALIAGLLTVVTALALSGSKSKPAPSGAEITALINRLGSDDADAVKQARHALIAGGTPSLPKLRLALSHENKRIVEQAHRVIDVIEGRKSEAEP